MTVFISGTLGPLALADHLPASLVRAHDSQEILRADSLLDDIRHGEDRAERLYGAAEAILRGALAAKDLRTAIQAIRAAADVMGKDGSTSNCEGTLRASLPLLRFKVPRKGYRF